MGQSCCRTNLALEATDSIGAGQPFFSDELDGRDTAQVSMLCLEDLPHPTFAQPLQEDVRTENEVLAFAVQQLISLVGREPTALDQFAGKGFWIGELEGVQFFQLLCVEQAMLAK